MEKEKKNRIFKPSKKLIIIIVVAILIVATLIGIFIYVGNKNRVETKSLHDLIYSSQDHEGEYAKINLAYVPYKFAAQDETLIYYLAMDKEGYMYVVRLTDETYNELVKLQEEKQNEFSYELKGYLFEMPEELRKIVIESYNEISEKQSLTEENLEEYIGSVYLDETMTPGINYKTVILIIAIILGLCGVAILIIIVMHKIKTKETKEEINKEEIKERIKKKFNKEGIKEKIKKKFSKKEIKEESDKDETKE